MKNFKYLLLLALCLVFISCSEDDDDNPVNPGDNNNNNGEEVAFYMPTTIDSYWIQETYDIENGARVDGSLRMDTITIIDDVLDTKPAYDWRLNRGDGTSTTWRFSEDSNAVFSKTNFILPPETLGLPLQEIPDVWVTILDKNNNTWTVLEEVILDGVNINLEGFSGELQDTKYNVSGANNGLQTVTFAGETMTVIESQIVTTIEGQVKIGIFPATNISTTITTSVWFKEDGGIMKTMTGDVVLSTVAGDFNFNGSESETIEYDIK